MKGKVFLKRVVATMLAITVLIAWSGTAGAAKWDGVIYIGYSGPLSGGAAKYGNNCLTGMKIAVDDVNAAGGVAIRDKKYELKLVYYDDMYKPANTVANVRRMISSEKPIMVNCPHAGGILALEKINEREGFLISGYTTNIDIISRNNKLVFSVPARADMAYGVEMLKRAFQINGPKLAHLTGSHEAGTAWMKLSGIAWKKLGGQVVIRFGQLHGRDGFLSLPYQAPTAQAGRDQSLRTFGTRGHDRQPGAGTGFQGRIPHGRSGQNGRDGESGQHAEPEQLRRRMPLRYATSAHCQGVREAAPTDIWNNYVPTYEAAAHYEVVWITVKAMEKALSKDDPHAIFKKFNEVLPAGKYATTMRDGLGPNGELLGITFAIAVKNGKFTQPIPLVWGKDLYPPGKKSAW